MQDWQKDLLIKAGLPVDLDHLIGMNVEFACHTDRRYRSTNEVRGVAFGGHPVLISFDWHAEPKTILFLCLNGDSYRADAHNPLPALAFDGNSWKFISHEGMAGWQVAVVTRISFA